MPKKKENLEVTRIPDKKLTSHNSIHEHIKIPLWIAEIMLSMEGKTNA